MKLVAVRHQPSHVNVWWFSVSDKLCDKVSVGSNVLCLTRKGPSEGEVLGVLECKSHMEAALITRNCCELKPVIAVNVGFKIDKIKIPECFLDSTPSSEKILHRIEDFSKTGKFNTPVIFNSNGELKDGYSAYIAAKLLNLTTLRGFCMEE